MQKLRNRQQFATVINKQSEPSRIELAPLLFLIYINDLTKAIMFSSVRHFTDATNNLYISSSLKYINKKINRDLSNLVQWFRLTEFR